MATQRRRAPSHPGKLLREVVLPAMRVSVAAAAREMAVGRQRSTRSWRRNGQLPREWRCASADTAATARISGSRCRVSTTYGTRSRRRRSAKPQVVPEGSIDLRHLGGAQPPNRSHLILSPRWPQARLGSGLVDGGQLRTVHGTSLSQGARFRLEDDDERERFARDRSCDRRHDCRWTVLVSQILLYDERRPETSLLASLYGTEFRPIDLTTSNRHQ
jgi:hypothetical protein